MAGTGDIAMSSNFNVSSQRPFDARFTVADLAGRNALPTVKRYDGLETYLEDTKATYRMVLGTVDTDLANNNNWVETTIVLGTTVISEFVNDVPYLRGGGVDNISELINDSGYLTFYTETDPIFTASAAFGISAGDIINWDTAFGWGDHALAGYLTSYTETDPVFIASVASSIVALDITQWDTAYTHSQLTTGNPHNVDATDVGAEPTFTKSPNQTVETNGSSVLITAAKGTAYNKAFGTSAGTVSEGNHAHATYFRLTSISTFTVGTSTGDCDIIRYAENSNGTELVTVTFRSDWAGGISGTNGTTIGSSSIPSVYRPSTEQVVLVHITGNTSMSVRIDSAGTITKTGGVGDSFSTNIMYGSITYIL